MCDQWLRTCGACPHRCAPQRCRCEPKVRAAKEADRTGLELLLCGRVAVHVGQAGYAMPLQMRRVRKRSGDRFPRRKMPGGSRQTRNGRLQSIEAVVNRQQAVPPERNDHRLLLDAENRRMGFRRAHGLIGNRGPLTPFLNRGRADRIVPSKRPYTRFTPRAKAPLDGPPLSWWRCRGEPVPYRLQFQGLNRNTS